MIPTIYPTVVMTPSEKITRTAPAFMTSEKRDMTAPVVTFAEPLLLFFTICLMCTNHIAFLGFFPNVCECIFR